MKTRILFLCAVMLFAFGCGSDDAKYAEQRKLVEDLLIPGAKMNDTEIIELYDGVAFYSEPSRYGNPWWFVREGKVYALDSQAQERTPRALMGAPSLKEALMPRSIENTRKNPPQLAEKHTGKGSTEFYMGFKSKLEGAGATVPESWINGGAKEDGNYKATFSIKEEGGYITSVWVTFYLTAGTDERAKKANSVPVSAMVFLLDFYVEDKEKRAELYNALIGPKFDKNAEKKEISATRDGLKYTFSLDNKYSELPTSEVPEYLQHIKNPRIYTIQVDPAE